MFVAATPRGPKNSICHLRLLRHNRVRRTGSLLTSEVKRRRARLVLRWVTAREDFRVLPALIKATTQVVTTSRQKSRLDKHRSHFGSRYNLGCCGHAGLFQHCKFNLRLGGYCLSFITTHSTNAKYSQEVGRHGEFQICRVTAKVEQLPWIPFGDHPLKLERYRED